MQLLTSIQLSFGFFGIALMALNVGVIHEHEGCNPCVYGGKCVEMPPIH